MTRPRGRGRPRSPENDGAILDAAAALLREQGFARMSMEGVAAAAGVSKPTLYLRYASKAELVVAVLVHLRIGGAPDLTGDLRADLIAQLQHLREVYEHTGMTLVGTCLAEEPRLPDLISIDRSALAPEPDVDLIKPRARHQAKTRLQRP